jgi:CcmD family protein
MSLLFAVAPELPLGKSGTFVAAAYIVVFAIILTYVAIMAARVQRIERELTELRLDDVEAPRATEAAVGGNDRDRASGS